MQPLLARVAKIRGYTTLMGLEKRQSSRWILGFSFKKQGVHVIGCKVDGCDYVTFGKFNRVISSSVGPD